MDVYLNNGRLTTLISMKRKWAEGGDQNRKSLRQEPMPYIISPDVANLRTDMDFHLILQTLFSKKFLLSSRLLQTYRLMSPRYYVHVRFST